jgi:hypothetical protein
VAIRIGEANRNSGMHISNVTSTLVVGSSSDVASLFWLVKLVANKCRVCVRVRRE